MKAIKYFDRTAPVSGIAIIRTVLLYIVKLCKFISTAYFSRHKFRSLFFVQWHPGVFPARERQNVGRGRHKKNFLPQGNARRFLFPDALTQYSVFFADNSFPTFLSDGYSTVMLSTFIVLRDSISPNRFFEDILRTSHSMESFLKRSLERSRYYIIYSTA